MKRRDESIRKAPNRIVISKQPLNIISINYSKLSKLGINLCLITRRCKNHPQIPGNFILQPICLDSLAGNARILGVNFVGIKKKEEKLLNLSISFA